jgi:hypothetical protein
MSRKHDDSDDDDDGPGDSTSFSLFVDKPWKNPFGMMVVKGRDVEEENTVIDKLTIMKPIFDYNDFDDKLYKGRLCADGGGIIATEPTIPGYLWKNPADIQIQVDNGESIDDVCKASYRTYQTIRTSTLTKEVTYRFPSGTTCNNEYFNTQNRRSSNLELDTDVVFYRQEMGEDENNNSIYTYCTFIVWRVAIDGAGKQTSAKDDDVTAATRALARLGIKKRGTNTTSAGAASSTNRGSVDRSGDSRMG